MSVTAPRTPPLPPPVAESLTPEHLVQLARARLALKKVRRAITVASVDGYAVATFAVLTLLTGLTDPPILLLALAMGGIAFVELRAARRLGRLDPGAPRTLAANQLAFGGVLTLYALTRLAASSHAPSAYAAYKAADPQLARMLDPIEDISRRIMQAVYVAMILIACVAQGGLAWYYASRVPHLRRYLAETPSWILGLHRSGVSL
jgi:hypothetical protein